MSILAKCILLFLMNWFDAQLTIFWVRANLATEGNGLMAYFLEMGNAPFLGVKLAIGAAAAMVLYKYSDLKIARRGLTLALGVYVCIMMIHAVTGLAALGWHGPETAVAYLGTIPHNLMAMLS
ncbi:MAG: DUF5658 family protein [Pyrinomonadaceae bacterium]